MQNCPFKKKILNQSCPKSIRLQIQITNNILTRDNFSHNLQPGVNICPKYHIFAPFYKNVNFSLRYTVKISFFSPTSQKLILCPRPPPLGGGQMKIMHPCLQHLIYHGKSLTNRTYWSILIPCSYVYLYRRLMV